MKFCNALFARQHDQISKKQNHGILMIHPSDPECMKAACFYIHHKIKYIHRR